MKITNRKQHRAAIKKLEELMELAVAVEEYEKKNFPIPKPTEEEKMMYWEQNITQAHL